MNNLLSYCGLVDARLSSSEKDLPIHLCGHLIYFYSIFITITFAIVNTRLPGLEEFHLFPVHTIFGCKRQIVLLTTN